MPNRILKESICTSDKLNELSWFEEILFYRLIVNCDDYGRFDGRIPVVKNRLFPLKDNLTAKTVKDGINKLVNVGLVALYECDGKPYLHLPAWNDHQVLRAHKSKYPAPEEGVLASENIGNHLHADDFRCAPKKNTNTNQNTNQNTNAYKCDEDFETFWSAYPRKEGKQKAKAAFAKVTVPLRDLLDAIDEQKKSAQWAKDGGQFIPHAATWLNGSRWLDQMTPASAAKNGVPMGASGDLGDEELEAIRKMMQMG